VSVESAEGTGSPLVDGAAGSLVAGASGGLVGGVEPSSWLVVRPDVVGADAEATLLPLMVKRSPISAVTATARVIAGLGGVPRNRRTLRSPTPAFSPTFAARLQIGNASVRARAAEEAPTGR